MSLIDLLGAKVIHSHVNPQLRGNRAKMAKVPCRQGELHTTKVQKHDSSVQFSLEAPLAMPETMLHCMCLGWSKHKTTFQSKEVELVPSVQATWAGSTRDAHNSHSPLQLKHPAR